MFDSELGHHNAHFAEPKKNLTHQDFEEITSDGLKSSGRTAGTEFFKNSPKIPKTVSSNSQLKQKPMY